MMVHIKSVRNWNSLWQNDGISPNFHFLSCEEQKFQAQIQDSNSTFGFEHLLSLMERQAKEKLW